MSSSSSSFSNVQMPFQFGNPFSLDAVLSSSYIDKHTQGQLSRVYLALAATVLSAAAGSFAHIQYRYFADPSISSLLSFLAMLGLMYTKPNKSNFNMRFAMLLAFGFLNGGSLGPLISLAIRVNPAILVAALLSTTLVFICFSICAMLSTRRSMLYLGGILSSLTTFLFLSSIANLFIRTTFIPWMHVYLGLFVFCGFILFDTQLIIEQIKSGNRDTLVMSMNLFVDFVAIFVRLLVILLRNEEHKSKKESRHSRR